MWLNDSALSTITVAAFFLGYGPAFRPSTNSLVWQSIKSWTSTVL